MWYIYITKRTAIKKNKMMPSSATWMQPEIIILSGIRKRMTMISLTCEISNMIQMNLSVKQKQNHQTKRTDLWLPRVG